MPNEKWDSDKFNRMHQTVNDIQIEVTAVKVIQEEYGKQVENIAKQLEKQNDGMQDKIKTLETDVGLRLHDDDPVFSQLHDHSRSLRRISAGVKSVWGIVATALAGYLAHLLGLFGGRN